MRQIQLYEANNPLRQITQSHKSLQHKSQSTVFLKSNPEVT